MNKKPGITKATITGEFIERLSTLETEVQQFQRSIEGIADSIIRMNDKIDKSNDRVLQIFKDFEVKVDQLSNKATESKQINWGVVTGFGALAITIFALLLGGYNKDQDRYDEDMEKFEKTQLSLSQEVNRLIIYNEFYKDAYKRVPEIDVLNTKMDSLEDSVKGKQ